MAISGRPLARLALWAALLGGCGAEAPPPDPTPGETSVVYACEGGRGFTATFQIGRNTVLMEVDGQSLALPQVPAGSGVAYSDGAVTFRAQGTQAFTQGWPSGDYVGCTGTNN
jgi:membrane-bound inhibitor of C-type lysozyme